MLRRWLGGGVFATLLVATLRVLVRQRHDLPPQPTPEVIVVPPEPTPATPKFDPPSFETLGVTRPPKHFDLTEWQRKRGMVIEIAARGLASRVDLPHVTVHQDCERCEWEDPSRWGICGVVWIFDAEGKEVSTADLRRDAEYRLLCLATPDDFLTRKPDLSKAVVVIGESRSKLLPVRPALTRYAEAQARLTPLGFGLRREGVNSATWELFVRYEERLTSIDEYLQVVSTTGAVLGDDEIFEDACDRASDGYPTREGRALLTVRAPLDFVPAFLKVRGKKVPLPAAQGLQAVPSSWHR